MLLGVHVSISGHIYESISRAVSLGCNVMQIFLREPRQWRRKYLESCDIEKFRELRAKSPIQKVFVHIPYSVNLASPVSALCKSSIKAYIEDIKETEFLGAEYLVTHLGSHKKSGEDKGLLRFIWALNKILERTKKSPVIILLENTAGSGSWLGYKFEHLSQIIKAVEYKNRIGICLDTCHTYAAGYDLVSSAGYRQTFRQLEELVGLERLKLIHLNDTKDNLASRRDRHEHIGKGKIGLEGFKLLLNDRRLKDAAFILETPRDSPAADKVNLDVVKKIVNAGS